MAVVQLSTLQGVITQVVTAMDVIVEKWMNQNAHRMGAVVAALVA
jgi:hypothetical protein